MLDLIDDNVSYEDAFPENPIGDNTTGYTIKQIENSLGKTWNEWKTNIINDHENTTEQYVQETFNFWN